MLDLNRTSRVTIVGMQTTYRARVTAKVVGQFHRPTGIGGHLAGWQMTVRPSNRARNRWVISLLELEPHTRVLEVGFGPGVAIREAARAATKGMAVGVDHSPVMLRAATRRNAAGVHSGRVHLHLGSADALPVLDARFDRIYAVNSLGFWPQPDRCLANLRTLLVPGGSIAIASQPRCPGATAETTEQAGDEIAALLDGAGFTSIRRETLALDPPVVCVLGVA
jgi:ubiquinone/menaquinone biosynthesis C-methylase UbiE